MSDATVSGTSIIVLRTAHLLGDARRPAVPARHVRRLRRLRRSGGSGGSGARRATGPFGDIPTGRARRTMAESSQARVWAGPRPAVRRAATGQFGVDPQLG